MLYIFLIAVILWNGVAGSYYEDDSTPADQRPARVEWNEFENRLWDCKGNTISDGVGPVYQLDFEECKNKFKDNAAAFVYNVGSRSCQQTTYLPRVVIARMDSCCLLCVDVEEKNQPNIVPGNWVNGWCETNPGAGSNDGRVDLGRGFDTDTCLDKCSRRPYSACEWNKKYRTCIRHTAPVTSASGNKKYRCYIPEAALGDENERLKNANKALLSALEEMTRA